VGEIEKACEFPIDFPIVCDQNARISTKYSMVSQSNISVRQNKALSTVRSVFVINPRKKVSLIMTYPVQIGRNFDEILRAVDALQRNEKYDVITPANWVHGDATIVPPLYSDEDAIEKFGYMQKKTDHVRFTKDPMAM
jgi:peroxiredoxin (alkyl hydroperoxide reductase subunit C)